MNVPSTWLLTVVCLCWTWTTLYSRLLVLGTGLGWALPHWAMSLPSPHFYSKTGFTKLPRQALNSQSSPSLSLPSSGDHSSSQGTQLNQRPTLHWRIWSWRDNKQWCIFTEGSGPGGTINNGALSILLSYVWKTENLIYWDYVKVSSVWIWG